jgi:hypothetical protein
LAVFVHLSFLESENCPTEKGASNRSEVSANATFLAKLSNKEIYRKWLLGFIGDVVTPLNDCEELADNSYKVLQGKYKMIPIL